VTVRNARVHVHPLLDLGGPIETLPLRRRSPGKNPKGIEVSRSTASPSVLRSRTTSASCGSPPQTPPFAKRRNPPRLRAWSNSTAATRPSRTNLSGRRDRPHSIPGAPLRLRAPTVLFLSMTATVPVNRVRPVPSPNWRPAGAQPTPVTAGLIVLRGRHAPLDGVLAGRDGRDPGPKCQSSPDVR